MTITRRAVLASGAGAAIAGLAGPGSKAFARITPRTRYSATSLQGKQMLAKYAKAVGIMMSDHYPPGDPRRWEFQWYTHWIPGPTAPWSAAMREKKRTINRVFAGRPANHPHRQLAEAMWDDCQAHASNPDDPNYYQQRFFLPWHRFFVFYFEEIVRGVLLDPTFTLPYWDYLGGSVSDLSIPAEFRNANSWLYKANRNSWVNDGERIDKQNPGALNGNAFKEPIYINEPNGDVGFCPMLDGNPHGMVHVLVGNTTNIGDVPTAAGDPVFWLHHCNIDRLWESWNRLGAKNPTWPDRSFTFADGNGRRVIEETKDANRVRLLNYDYDRYYLPKEFPEVTASNSDLVARPLRKVVASGEVRLDPDRTVVPIPSADTAGQQDLLLSATPSRSLYLVLAGLAAAGAVQSTYNVFLARPHEVTAPGSDDPHYVGTLNFFGAGSHDHHHGSKGHNTVFNITQAVRMLRTQGKPDATTTLTLVRRGPERESVRPLVQQIYLLEA